MLSERANLVCARPAKPKEQGQKGTNTDTSRARHETWLAATVPKRTRPVPGTGFYIPKYVVRLVTRTATAWCLAPGHGSTRRVCSGLGLTELEAVAERVGDMAAAGSWQRFIGLRLKAGGSQALLEGGQVVDQQTGMCLASGCELLFHAHVELLRAGLEPAASTGLQRLRLW